MSCSEQACWCSPLPLQVLGGNLVLEDLEVALALRLVQLSQPQALIQLQRLTAQRHNLVHLHIYSAWGSCGVIGTGVMHYDCCNQRAAWCLLVAGQQAAGSFIGCADFHPDAAAVTPAHTSYRADMFLDK